MLSSMTITDKRRFSLLLILASVIAIYFWTQSRMPALDHKAQMGQRAVISSLSFDVIMPVQADDPYTDRVIANGVNWCYTNWKGMTFGLAFSAAVLAMITLLNTGPRRRLSLFRQSVLGTLIGTPLGVCANCSTPIAVGMYRGGTPLGMALAVISASPTLNIIVLTMAISLVPFELVLLKYIAVFFYLLVALPWLLHLIPNRLQQSYAASVEVENSVTRPLLAPFALTFPAATNWLQALAFATLSYLAALWFVIKVTLPFMILAGFLGVALAEALPINQLMNQEMSLLVLLVAAAVATFFPVPMAFDVVITVSLLAMGVPVAYVAALFFALGIFSIYPGLVIARDISVRISLAIGLVITLLAFLVGLGAQTWVDMARADRVAQINQVLPSDQAGLSDQERTSDGAGELKASLDFCRSEAADSFQSCLQNALSRQDLTMQANLPCAVVSDDARAAGICTQVRRLAQAQRAAQEAGSVLACASLAVPERSICESAAAFALASEHRDLNYCAQLGDAERSDHCQFEALSIGMELYDANEMCATLTEATARTHCESQLIAITEMNRHIQSNDLSLCLNLSDPNAQQYCQGVVMVNLLEKGASPELCAEIKAPFLQQRCQHFVQYFRAQAVLDGAACQNIPDPSLQQQCLQEVRIARFEQQRLHLRYQQLKQVELSGVVTSILPSAPVMPNSDSSVTNFDSVAAGEGWSLSAQAFAQRDAGSGFTPIDADVMGLSNIEPMQAEELFEPFTYGRGIASGDFNNDGSPDLIFATGTQVQVYRNGGGKFEFQQALMLPAGVGLAAPILVVFADLNQDGWDDVLASFYGAGIGIFINRQGYFDATPTARIELPESNLVMAAGFIDADLDGDLDVVAGSWSFGDFRHFQPTFSRNYLLLNSGDGLNFEARALSGPDGETLSVLLSDLDSDGKTELAIANDRDAPDLFYRWQDDTYQLSFQDKKLPSLTSYNTMSLDSADINNDGHLDYFSVDMSFEPAPPRSYCDVTKDGEQRKQCLQLLQAKEALERGDIDSCLSLPKVQRQSCLRAQLIQLAHDSRKPDYCARIPDSSHAAQTLCLNGSVTLPPPAPIDFREFLPGVQRNVLMVKDPGSGQFVNRANDMGVARTRWSWNARFADLDNDGWQDLYVGNGFMFGTRGRDIHSNMFFRNIHGERFEEMTTQAGLQDYLNTPGFTYLDLDSDGDLDMVSTHVGALPGVFINRAQGNSIRFVLEDVRGNRRGIGAWVSIENAAGRQVREIKLSGGYLSYDAPVAHFGLGEHEFISKVTVRWPDGTQTVITQELSGGRLYRVRRN